MKSRLLGFEQPAFGLHIMEMLNIQILFAVIFHTKTVFNCFRLIRRN